MLSEISGIYLVPTLNVRIQPFILDLPETLYNQGWPLNFCSSCLYFGVLGSQFYTTILSWWGGRNWTQGFLHTRQALSSKLHSQTMVLDRKKKKKSASAAICIDGERPRSLWCPASEPHAWKPTPSISVIDMSPRTPPQAVTVSLRRCSYIPSPHCSCSPCFLVIDACQSNKHILFSYVRSVRVQEPTLWYWRASVGLPLNHYLLLQAVREYLIQR